MSNKEKQQDVMLSSKQLKGLDMLANLDVEKLAKNKKLSWVGKVFQWIDDNILDKSSRLIMYVLEIAGVVAIYIIINDIQFGLHKVMKSTTEFELKKAESYLTSLVQIAPALATMIATICGALPTIIGVMRSVNTKWKNANTAVSESEEKESTTGYAKSIPPVSETAEGK